MNLAFKTILVATDFSDASNLALEYARVLAARFGAARIGHFSIGLFRHLQVGFGTDILSMGRSGDDIAWDMIRLAFASVADMPVAPMQDVLDLGNEARMNVPGAEKDNWSWRMPRAALTPAHAERLRRLAEMTGRIPGA